MRFWNRIDDAAEIGRGLPNSQFCVAQRIMTWQRDRHARQAAIDHGLRLGAAVDHRDDDAPSAGIEHAFDILDAVPRDARQRHTARRRDDRKGKHSAAVSIVAAECSSSTVSQSNPLRPMSPARIGSGSASQVPTLASPDFNFARTGLVFMAVGRWEGANFSAARAVWEIRTHRGSRPSAGGGRHGHRG